LLDSLSTRKSNKVLQFSNMLFEADYNPLALFSLVFGHVLLIRSIKELEGASVPVVSKKLGIHSFRVQKAMVACRHWTQEDIHQALQDLAHTDVLMRTWQYDQKMLVQMLLIKLCL